jgi:hypothetical protein
MRVAFEHGKIRTAHDRDGEGQDFENSGSYAHDTSPDATDHAISSGRRVSFVRIHCRDRDREFGPAKQKIRNAAPELSRWALIVRGRIVNVSAADGRYSNRQREREENSHKRSQS